MTEQSIKAEEEMTVASALYAAAAAVSVESMAAASNASGISPSGTSITAIASGAAEPSTSTELWGFNYLPSGIGVHPTNYPTTSYIGYPLNGEFGDPYSSTFFQCPQLSYGYTAANPIPEVPVNEDEESVSPKETPKPNPKEYSTAETSRSQSADSTRKETPSFYSEIKPFGSANCGISCSPFETFCTVPGRTSLLSSTTKYRVTIGEIQRRISPPECLNASLLGGILRKAKSKDGGKALRESLRRIGLTLPAGRRKSAHVTALTALVEEEAVHMAKDFHGVCERDFPSKELALFLSRHITDEDEAHRRRTMLHYTRVFLKEVSDLMNSDRSPVCANRPDIILDPSIQKHLTHFSMVTHGFGGLVMVSVLDVLNACVHESLKHLDRTFRQPAATQQYGLQPNQI